MNNHLPECPYMVVHATLPMNRSLICICAELRACEQRVIGLRLDDLNVKSYEAALRDAVETVRMSPSADIELVERSQIITEIEALGGER